MAHHNNTPKIVLNAPTITRKWIVQYKGENRASRRHAVLPNGMRVRLPFIPLGKLAPNQPYRKTRRPIR